LIGPNTIRQLPYFNPSEYLPEFKHFGLDGKECGISTTHIDARVVRWKTNGTGTGTVGGGGGG